MKTKKYIFIILSIICLSFLFIMINMKIKFDKVYEERKDVSSIYNELYQSGALKIIQEFFVNNFDTIDQNYQEIISTPTHKILKIRLRDLEKYTKDKKILDAAKKLVENEFYNIKATKNLDLDFTEIYTKKVYLTYKSTPTYHYLIYYPEEKNRYSYMFNKNDDWYAFASDSPEDAQDFSTFLDITPEWLLPYFEARSFFKKN